MVLRRTLLSSVLLCCLLALFALPFASPLHALSSDQQPLTISAQATSVHFPTSVTFNATATDSASNIVSASITVNLNTGVGFDLHPVTIKTPARTEHLTWYLDTSGNNFLPAGTTIDYYWKLSDALGNTYSQPQQELTTTDTRFTWQHLNSGMLQVNWYNRGQDFGQILLNQASASVNRISKTLGGGLLHPINMWVYETTDDFHGSLPPSSYEWVGGIAFPSLSEASIVVAGTADNTLVRDMPHELTHLIFHQLIVNGTEPPTWFDEGLAVYNQVYHEPDLTIRLQKALATQSLLRLADISFRFPVDSDQAFLAYAQSWNLVQYMFDTYGQPKMQQFIRLMNDPSFDFGEDMIKALGVDIAHLENAWRLHLNQPGTLTPDEMTPTAAPTTVPHLNTSNGSDDRSWVLLVLGGVLVAGSLFGLFALFIVTTRNRRRAQMANLSQASLAAPPIDPALYMRSSMYAGAAQQPLPPHAPPAPQQFPQETPPGGGQDYPAPPRRYFPQE